MSLAQVMPPFERGGLESRTDDEMLLIRVLPDAWRQLLYEVVDDLVEGNCVESRDEACKRGKGGFKEESVCRKTASRSVFVGQRELRLFCFSSLLADHKGGHR